MKFIILDMSAYVRIVENWSVIYSSTILALFAI